MMKKTAIIIISAFLVACNSTEREADLIVYNANVITMDERNPKAEAIAMKEGRIIYVGDTQGIEQFNTTDENKIDLKGKCVIPGLIESHAHFLGLGKSLMQLRLEDAANWDEILAMVEKAVREAKPGQWITGRGWHQDKWNKHPENAIQGYPVHSALSRISPDNPVMLTHASGHALFANALAMRVAGVNSTTPDPEGGEIVRFGNGTPCGVFIENAELLISERYYQDENKRSEARKREEDIEAIQKAGRLCLSYGITSFHDAGATFKEVDLFKKLADSGDLPIRLWVMLYENNEILEHSIERYKLKDYGGNFLSVGGIKRWMDGALGSRGAWLLKPYSDLPSTHGLNTVPLDEFRKTAQIAYDHGFQLCTHAIGDKANRETLNIYEEIFSQSGQNSDLRWRIEHAQHLSADDIFRFGELGVTAAMQAVHCVSDGPWVEKRLGPNRAQEGAYVWRKLMDTGAVICNGTDAPVEKIDPFANFYAMVSRKMKSGDQFYNEQVLTREEVLKTYTINGAYAVFQDGGKGSITMGKLADLVVLSDDILTVHEEKIAETKVLYTILNGKIVFQDQG